MRLHATNIIISALLALTSLTAQAEGDTPNSLTLNSDAGSLTFSAGLPSENGFLSPLTGAIPVAAIPVTTTTYSVSDLRFDLLNHQVIGTATDSTGVKRDVVLWTTTGITGPTTVDPATLPGYLHTSPIPTGSSVYLDPPAASEPDPVVIRNDQAFFMAALGLTSWPSEVLPAAAEAGGNAIPEPATWLLMGLGLGGIALTTRRRH